MTWTINMGGHDELGGEEKVAAENDILEKAKALAQELEEMAGNRVSHATIVTNTHGSVNLLAKD